jgi:hypothetical protein
MAGELVAIPWQPHLFVAPSYLARLERASDFAGHKIFLNSEKSPTGRYLSAWRALEEAIYLYDLYLHHGGNLASNPYNGARFHLRGAGGDIRDRADRAAMLRAGFIAEPKEWWHFSDPNWSRMPIIAINTQTAGHGTLPLSAVDKPLRKIEDDMDTTFYQPTDNSTSGRIWAGPRTLPEGDPHAIAYSDVWGVADNGEGRRLTRKQWVDIYARYVARDQLPPIVRCTGNELEAILYAQKF